MKLSIRFTDRLMILLTAWGILVGTYDLGSISISLPKLIVLWHLSGWQQSLLGSSSLLGMIIGSLGAGILADRFGRRSVLVFDFATFVVAEAISAVAPNITIFIAARFIVGVGIGADFATAFPYLSEMLSETTRGRIMAAVMWAANFGMLGAYGVGAFCLLLGANGWRYTLALGALFALPLLYFRSALPESPLWLRGHVATFTELKTTWGHLRMRRMIAINGVNWFLYQISDQGLSLFLPTFLVGQLGASVARDVAASLMVKTVTIPAALLTIFLIDRKGRRPLQIWGFLGRALGLFTLAALTFSTAEDNKFCVILALIATYAFGALGPDKTTVIVPAEQFPTEMRASGQGITEAIGRIGGVVGVMGYALLSTSLGVSAGLLLFAMAAFTGFIVTLYTTRETNQQPVAFLQDSDCISTNLGDENHRIKTYDTYK
ncbi:MFS transporter [Sulfoacidibacillus thermotolerans]|uniref:Major facilitator superfamily (MFS) profile domain-containing protein n=1 Tax=Sulfoacidibacillus thermotolerans TaxID=1765684 RepID=A0A2U3D972_SULT2|nr:MFS transporter [Sulfoacidibacillus thermotolerans]PWI57824.1 hypothetical protein BM613_06440 [Sulfoacidibacillus thermotolerans]